MLNNITNLLQDLGKENVEVACVANGAGTIHFKKEGTPYQDDIEVLAAKGVHFLICSNSLNPVGGKREHYWIL